jgi:hypothetical protein
MDHGISEFFETPLFQGDVAGVDEDEIVDIASPGPNSTAFGSGSNVSRVLVFGQAERGDVVNCAVVQKERSVPEPAQSHKNSIQVSWAVAFFDFQNEDWAIAGYNAEGAFDHLFFMTLNINFNEPHGALRQVVQSFQWDDNATADLYFGLVKTGFTPFLSDHEVCTASSVRQGNLFHTYDAPESPAEKGGKLRYRLAGNYARRDAWKSAGILAPVGANIEGHPIPVAQCREHGDFRFEIPVAPDMGRQQRRCAGTQHVPDRFLYLDKHGGPDWFLYSVG